MYGILTRKLKTILLVCSMHIVVTNCYCSGDRSRPAPSALPGISTRLVVLVVGFPVSGIADTKGLDIAKGSKSSCVRKLTSGRMFRYLKTPAPTKRYPLRSESPSQVVLSEIHRIALRGHASESALVPDASVSVSVFFSSSLKVLSG